MLHPVCVCVGGCGRYSKREREDSSEKKILYQKCNIIIRN